MRHGSVDDFAVGEPQADTEHVHLSAAGRAQADAAGGPLLANFQQAPGCINAIDAAVAPLPWLARFTGRAPHDAAQRDTRDSTMETLFEHCLASQGGPA